MREGDSAQLEFQVTERKMKQFADLSGDRNPLHWDFSAAKKRGLKAPVVYGGLLLSFVSGLIGMKLPGPGCLWHNVSMDFVSPLFVNEKATLKGEITYINPEMRVFRMNVEINRDGELIARGKIQGGYE